MRELAFLLARDLLGDHALVVLERGVPLGDIMARGVELSTRLTLDVLLTVFHHETPLHDGALIARGNQVSAVACILPLASQQSLPASMGTRHRAAVGVTEESDALALVVSEERGEMSLCFHGNIARDLDAATLRKALLGLFYKEKRKKQRVAEEARAAAAAAQAVAAIAQRDPRMSGQHVAVAAGDTPSSKTRAETAPAAGVPHRAAPPEAG